VDEVITEKELLSYCVDWRYPW